MKKVCVTPRKRPTQQRASATVDSLLEATGKTLVKMGYAATTTNHVAAIAGVSVGSLYQYFPNKDALIIELARSLVKDDIAHVEGEIAASFDLPLRDGWVFVMTSLLNRFTRDAPLRRVLLEQCPRIGKQDLFAEFRAALGRMFLSEVGRRQGITIDCLEVPTFLIVQCIEGVLRGSLSEPGRHFNREHLSAELIQFVLSYIDKLCEKINLGNVSIPARNT